MKAARFLFNIIGFGALSIGVGFAAEPPRPPSKEAPRQHAPNSVRPATLPHVGQEHLNPGAVRSSQPAALPSQTPHPLGNEVHQATAKKLDTPAHSGAMMNKMEIHHDMPAKLPGAGASTAPWTSAVRSRSATPPVHGGLNMPTRKNSTVALSGLAVKGKR